MTDEQKKIVKYLESPFYIEKKIDALQMLLDSNQAIIDKHGDNIDENITNKINSFNMQIKSEIEKIINVRKDIYNVIITLNNPDLESILINRHLNYYSFEKTAEIMNYSVSCVKSKHRAAIKIFAEKCVLK